MRWSGWRRARCIQSAAGLDRVHAGRPGQGRWWTHTLTPRHGAGRALSIETVGTVLPDRLVLFTLFDLDERRQRQVDREADRHMRAGLSEWQRMERIFRDIERENQLILRAAGRASTASMPRG